MSACVTACVATQSIVAPGASVAGNGGEHGPSARSTPPKSTPAPGSVTVTPVNVTLPVFVTLIAYAITSPTDRYGPSDVTDLTMSSAGVGTSVFVIVHVTFAAAATLTVAAGAAGVPVVPLLHVQVPTA